MSINQELIRLMGNQSLHQISFSISGHSVLGREMPRVAAAIQSGQWKVEVNPSAPKAYISIEQRLIVLTKPCLIGTDAIYEALHECTHAMLVLTGVDQPGMGVMVEIAATLLPIIYFFKTRPIEAGSGLLFEQTDATRAFVDFVRQHRMYETSVNLTQTDIQDLYLYTKSAILYRR